MDEVVKTTGELLRLVKEQLLINHIHLPFALSDQTQERTAHGPTVQE